MKCREIIDILETLAPKSCACDWDNPGLLAGRMDKDVKKILLTLDADDAAVERAKEIGADMLLSHHPLIFKPVKHVSDEDFIGKRLVSLIQTDVSDYAMHTNFDSAPGCMADIVADRLNFVDQKPLELMGELSGTAYGIGKTGTLKKPMTGPELAREVKNRFGLPFVTVYGSELYENEPVTRAATCPGAGGSEIREALRAGAQVFITGDISHHEGIDAAAQGMMIIDAGHYGLEHVFMDFMEGFLRDKLPEEVAIEKMAVKFPAVVI